MHGRSAFTLIESLLVIAVISALAGLSIPLYRSYQIRSDLDFATEQVVQALGRAKILAQGGEGQSAWGYHVASGILYKGKTYTGRDAAFDEEYAFSETIVTSGLAEASFSPLEGLPSTTGTILLMAISGEQREVNVTITAQGIAVDDTDTVTFCHNLEGQCETKTLPESAWQGHQQHGDTLGPCDDECEDDD